MNRQKELTERIIEGDNYFMLSENYQSQLEKLPCDILKNMIIELIKKNKALKFKIKSLEKVLNDEFMTHGR